MVVTVADVQKLLPAYKGLTTDQITGAIESAQAYLDGINPDWAQSTNADTIQTFAAASITLQLHFPQNVNAYTASFQLCRENHISLPLNPIARII